jgi:UMP-CMP kinase
MFIGTAAVATLYKRRQIELSKQPPLPELPICEVVFVLGGPGAGKGTQCQLLHERLGDANGGEWQHLSAGDLLRAERESGGELGRLINAKIAAGELVPSSITVRCLERGMITAFRDNKTTKFLIDGFPRSHENMSAWEDTMGDHTIKFVLDFECPEEVL